MSVEAVLSRLLKQHIQAPPSPMRIEALPCDVTARVLYDLGMAIVRRIVTPRSRANAGHFWTRACAPQASGEAQACAGVCLMGILRAPQRKRDEKRGAGGQILCQISKQAKTKIPGLDTPFSSFSFQSSFRYHRIFLVHDDFFFHIQWDI